MLSKIFSVHYGKTPSASEPVSINRDILVKDYYMTIVGFNTEYLELTKFNTAKSIFEAIQDRIRDIKDEEIAIDLRNISKIAYKEDPLYTINQKITCQNLVNLILYAAVAVPKFPRHFIFYEENEAVLAKLQQFKEQFKGRPGFEAYYDRDLPDYQENTEGKSISA